MGTWSASIFGNDTSLDIKDEFSILVPLALAIGVGIGFVGSFFTVRRHIDV